MRAWMEQGLAGVVVFLAGIIVVFVWPFVCVLARFLGWPWSRPRRSQ